MIGRLMGIGGILTGIATGITALVSAHIITIPGLLWGLSIVGLAVLGYVLSFGWTEFYKRTKVPALKTLSSEVQDVWKRAIYRHAVVSGFLFTAFEGVFLFTSILTGKPPTMDAILQLGIYMALWLVGAAAIGLSSPFVWKLVFEVAWAWILNADPSLGVEIRRDSDNNVVSIKDHTKPDDKTQVVTKPPTAGGGSP